MIPNLRTCARAACALLLVACAPETSPTSPPTDSAVVLVPESVLASTMEPTTEELATLPVGFQRAPTILNNYTEVGFTADGAYAEGVTEYFGTDASQDVTLIVRFDGREIGRRTTTASQDDFLPAHR